MDSHFVVLCIFSYRCLFFFVCIVYVVVGTFGPLFHLILVLSLLYLLSHPAISQSMRKPAEDRANGSLDNQKIFACLFCLCSYDFRFRTKGLIMC